MVTRQGPAKGIINTDGAQPYYIAILGRHPIVHGKGMMASSPHIDLICIIQACGGPLQYSQV